MSLMLNIVAPQNNDKQYTFQITQVGNIVNPPMGTVIPLNLTNLTPKMYVKASATALDSTATVYTVGSGLTIINAALGRISFLLPHTATTVAGTQWWRLDLIDSLGNVGTALYGNLYILAV